MLKRRVRCSLSQPTSKRRSVADGFAAKGVAASVSLLRVLYADVERRRRGGVASSTARSAA
jgi:hypothetical protein